LTDKAWNKESGASLVAIMMSLAIFAIVAMMAARSFRNINVSGRKVEAAMSAREAENLILQTLTRQFRAYIEAGCTATPNSFFQNTQIGTLALANHKNPRFYTNTTQYIVTTPPDQAKEDVRRCQSTPFVAAAVTTNNANTFYGCFDLQTVQTARQNASKDAFAGNRGAFIEMYVKLKNLKTDTPVTCANMVQSLGFGFEVYYSLHWATSAGDSVLYDSKLGTFNVGYEDET
jgi:type II secretory pathway pseudopilin PulG